MSDLVVIVPSRGRPRAAHELAEAFAQTSTADTALVFAVDDTDPTRDAYAVPHAFACVTISAHTSMVDALNKHAAGWAKLGDGLRPYAVGFMGDDHRPRTKGWDARYLDELRQLGTGMVFGDDLVQHEALPTQVAMTADIVRTLGYMAPPALTHMYVDNAWLALGRELDRIRYLPDVVVEHLHPVAGTAEWDDGYRRVNAAGMYARDRAMYLRWLRDDLPGAVESLLAVCGA